ncbi:MAG: hydroxyacid dehydrogenase [Proteobacteria bacterium]|nr:hydroxyacid dehydrogenase [Pseudomonadota bacterium]MBI3499460.1 hydroxyacid dehydrogenase [Pseudomonadota bacterium]
MREQKYGAKAVAGLAALGTLALNETDDILAPDRLIERARDCAIIVSDRLTPAPAHLFQGLPRLIALVRNAMDIRNIDVPAASASGVLVTRAGPGFIPAVVELLLGQMVDLARGTSDYVAAYRAGRIPEQRLGIQLAGKTAGVIGYGNLGRRMADVLAFLGMRVLVHDPYAKTAAAAVLLVDLDRLLGEADFVLCLAVHSKETEGMLNAGFFRRMKPTAFLINPSRGPVLIEDDLVAALREKRIAGAALDVGNEPDDIPPVKLGRLANVIAAPHIGGMVPDSMESQAQDTVDQVRQILAGEMPKFAVNPTEARRFKTSARA